jgi:MFS family permease
VPPHRANRWLLASISLPVLGASLATSIASVSLPSLAQSFAASFQQIQWVVLSYLLCLTTLVVVVGKMGDVVGHRRLLLVGIGIFTAASTGSGLAPTLGTLITARAVQGLAAAILLTSATAIGSAALPREQMGRALGLLGTMSAIGTALGPALGGGLIALAGWRAVFLVNLPLGIAAFFLARRHLPGDRERRRLSTVPMDYPGTLLLAGILATYVLAATLGRGRLGFLNGGLLFAAIMGAGVLVRVERKALAPILPVRMCRDGGLVAGLATNVIVATVLMATLVVGPFYLSRVLGLEAALLGMVLAVGPVVAACASIPAGRLVDRLGAERAGLMGLAGIGGGAMVLALMPTAAGVAGYVGGIIGLTCSYALFQTANQVVLIKPTPVEERGMVSALLTLSRNLGLLTGASLMGTVFALAANRPDIATAGTDAVVAGFRAVFALATGLVISAIAVRQIRWRGRGAGPQVDKAAPERAVLTPQRAD